MDGWVVQVPRLVVAVGMVRGIGEAVGEGKGVRVEGIGVRVERIDVFVLVGTEVGRLVGVRVGSDVGVEEGSGTGVVVQAVRNQASVMIVRCLGLGTLIR
jgi:hypothetical protein